MQDIIIVGAGGLGREVLAILKNCNALQATYNILGFVDDGKSEGETINNTKVLGGVEYLNSLTHKTGVIIAISLPKIRKAIYNKISNSNIYYPTLLHPSVILSDEEFLRVGKGCIFCINTVLTTNISLGDFVLLNAGAIINHDAEIESFSTIMPGVNISTGAKVSEGCYIGTGSKISKPETIPAWEALPAGTIIA
jgi:sugar O-acyltransferase (sialic acid O-acetyltransferase NeuD family)